MPCPLCNLHIGVLGQMFNEFIRTHEQHASALTTLALAGGNEMISVSGAQALAQRHRALVEDAKETQEILSAEWEVELGVDPSRDQNVRPDPFERGEM